MEKPEVTGNERPLPRWPFSFVGLPGNPWRGLSGLPREVWLLFATNLINRAGMMVLPFLVLYLTRGLGFTAAQAGVAFALYGATAIFVGPISGRLSDRFGPLPIMRASLLASGAMLLLLSLARSYSAVLTLIALWAACTEFFRPASLAAITHVAAAEQRKPAFALNRLAINLGMSIGPALGGFLATVSFPAMFVVDGITTLIAGTVLASTSWRDPVPPATENMTDADGSLKNARLLTEPRFFMFLLATVLVGVVFFQHESGLPLYMVEQLHLSPAFYGTLFTINTLLIVAFEVPINTWTSHWPNAWPLAIGSMLFAIGFGGLAVIQSPAGILVLVVIWTFGEMALFPAMSAHLGDVAPPHRRGAYMGAYSMSLSIALAVGPWLGTQLFASVGAVVLWSIMFVLAALAAVLMVFAAGPQDSRSAAAAAESWQRSSR